MNLTTTGEINPELSARDLQKIQTAIKQQHYPTHRSPIPGNAAPPLSAAQLIDIARLLRRDFAPAQSAGQPYFVILPLAPRLLHAFWRLPTEAAANPSGSINTTGGPGTESLQVSERAQTEELALGAEFAHIEQIPQILYDNPIPQPDQIARNAHAPDAAETHQAQDTRHWDKSQNVRAVSHLTLRIYPQTEATAPKPGDSASAGPVFMNLTVDAEQRHARIELPETFADAEQIGASLGWCNGEEFLPLLQAGPAPAPRRPAVTLLPLALSKYIMPMHGASPASSTLAHA